MPSQHADPAYVDTAAALRGILALLVADDDGLRAPQRTERILAAVGLRHEQIASLRALGAREESVIDRARATLIARSPR